MVAVQGGNSSHNIKMPNIASITVLKMGMATVANYKPNKVQTLPLKLQAHLSIGSEARRSNNINERGIRRHGSEVYLGMSPVQNGVSYLMY